MHEGLAAPRSPGGKVGRNVGRSWDPTLSQREGSFRLGRADTDTPSVQVPQCAHKRPRESESDINQQSLMQAKCLDFAILMTRWQSSHLSKTQKCLMKMCSVPKHCSFAQKLDWHLPSPGRMHWIARKTPRRMHWRFFCPYVCML